MKKKKKRYYRTIQRYAFICWIIATMDLGSIRALAVFVRSFCEVLVVLVPSFC